MGVPAAGRDLTLTDHQQRARSAVDAAIVALRRRGHEVYWVPVRQVPEVEALHRFPADLQRSVVIDLVNRRATGAGFRRRLLSLSSGVDERLILGKLIASFANRSIPWTRGDAAIVLHLTDMLVRHASDDDDAIEAVPQSVAAVERVVGKDSPGDLSGAIERLAEALSLYRRSGTRAAKYRARLVALIGGPTEVLDPHMVTDGDSWGAAWKTRLPTLPASSVPLLRHLTLVASVEPPQKWMTRARELVADKDAQDLLRLMLDDIESTRLKEVPIFFRSLVPDADQLSRPSFQDRNALVLRGAIWAAAVSGAPWVADRLGAIGVVCGTSGRRDNEAREVRLANACAVALGVIDSEAAFAAIGRMKAKVTNRIVSKQIAKALEGAAARRGTSPSELLELSIATMGLDADGRREEPVGDHVAVISIGPDGGASLAWRGPDGTQRATPPKRIAETFAVDARRLKDEAKDLKKALSIERGRIEDLLVEDREWDIATWRTRYLEHPLTGSFGRRLIWRITDPGTGESTPVMPAHGDAFVAAAGSPVPVPADARVRLWHPIDAPEADVSAWRGAVLERHIRQPFKQAYREVYVLTPAEEATEAYSNRFAAHILLYAQARALMSTRRWATNFLGPFDGGYEGIAKHEFPSHRIRAEFYHDAIDDEAAGMVEHCTTDQVRFVAMGPGPGAAVVLRDVPPIVFSEAMRDVDLFVGVSSIGADRNWQDAGQQREGRYAQLDAYFDRYGTEALTANAQVRRDVIERILPGLVIADRCELQDRWLRVRGDIRSYRIHLGSGNILMEPTDRYLCIVPARGDGAASRVFLPFDDDPTLALILSKAFLLANDTAIRDRTIIQQIEAR